MKIMLIVILMNNDRASNYNPNNANWLVMLFVHEW